MNRWAPIVLSIALDMLSLVYLIKSPRWNVIRRAVFMIGLYDPGHFIIPYCASFQVSVSLCADYETNHSKKRWHGSEKPTIIVLE
jgi:hypothetical protein